MNETYLSLGSNEGDRAALLESSITLLSRHCGMIEKTSAIYETAAWGLTDQPDFLNCVLLLKTDLSPADLLEAIHHIEAISGRNRIIKWGPRTIDIDILFYNDLILQSPSLTIPHPFLHERRFILTPLSEIAPSYIHPSLHKSVTELLETCPDPLQVKIYNKK